MRSDLPAEPTLARAVAVFRVAALVLAVGLAIHARDRYAHPGRGWVVLALMAGWSVPASWPLRRQALLRTTDVLVTVAAVLATRLVDTAGRIDGGAATLPVAWAAAAVLAAGMAGGPVAGGSAGVVLAAAGLLERGAVTGATLYNGVLLVVAGGIAGYLARLGARARAAESAAAAERERSRLAGDIHDSVLQVLALVARRGRDAGGEAAELARLAGEQEVALRSLVGRSRAAAPGRADLAALLRPLESGSVAVAAPAGVVGLDEPVAVAVAAAVGAALDNVHRHAGPAARAWVLLEDEADGVAVSVRDDGVGFAPGRLAEAAAAGRLGVADAVLGRLAAVGGSATVTSTPGAGTEVEIRVPRRR